MRTHVHFDKTRLLCPPPWYAAENQVEPEIPEVYEPMRIVELDWPREPLGNLFSVKDDKLILLNYHKQRNNGTIDQIKQEIEELPNSPEEARQYLKEAVQDYLASIITQIDDICHQQNVFPDCSIEKAQLSKIIDQLRWRQGVNELQRHYLNTISAKRQMASMLRNIRSNLEKGESELIQEKFPSKH